MNDFNNKLQEISSYHLSLDGHRGSEEQSPIGGCDGDVTRVQDRGDL